MFDDDVNDALNALAILSRDELANFPPTDWGLH